MAIGSIVFKDYTSEVNEKLTQAARAWLEEASSEVESQAIRNTRVDTGRTKSSFHHKVFGSALEAAVGSDYQNAIWEEFGTGVYAENGGRTKVPWFYKDAKGEGHRTSGKRGTRAFRKAYTSTSPKLKKRARQIFKDTIG